MAGGRRNKSGRIHVLVADDHLPVLKGIRAQLRSTPDIVVVGLATSGAQAVDMATRLLPNVIVMDCDMPGAMPSAEAARQILELSRQIRIIGVCDQPLGGRAIKTMFECGAAGIIEKTTLCEELLFAVRTVHLGHRYLGRSLADVIVTNFICPKANSLPSDVEGLSSCEAEIHRMTLEGMSAKQIAAKRNCSSRTVETIRRHIRLKAARKSAVHPPVQ